jgi:glycosyltransferase involved in cell wall biosynthesis
MRIAIGVITRRRPQGLRRLLESFDGLDLSAPSWSGNLARPLESEGIRAEVLIVENDDSPGMGDPPPCRLPLRREFEPRLGIPFARNRVIEMALADESPRGFDAIAFVDDDETVDPSWLRELVATISTTGADAVTGPALAAFEGGDPPRWALRSGAFDCLDFPSGTSRPTAFTHNVLVTTRALRETGLRFDERLAMTGGSDTQLFTRLALAGRRIVWCREAICHEWTPSSRLTVAWARQRAYRIGATDAWIARDLGTRSRAGLLWLAMRYLLRGPFRLLSGLPTRGLAGSTVACLQDFAKARGLVAGALGFFRHEEYRTHHGR